MVRTVIGYCQIILKILLFCISFYLVLSVLLIEVYGCYSYVCSYVCSYQYYFKNRSEQRLQNFIKVAIHLSAIHLYAVRIVSLLP